jgi:hypothetical protein
LDDTVGDNGGSQFSELIFVDPRARLERVAINLIKGNFAGFAAFRFNGNGSGSLDAREQGVKAFAESTAFGVKGSDGHDSKSSKFGEN